MQWLASLFFTIFLFAWTGMYAVLFSIVAIMIPFRYRSMLARGWAQGLLFTLKWVCRLDYRVEGREHLPKGNHIALLKHSSSWETFAQVVLLPDQVWVLKRELTWVPFLGWALRFMRAIAVDRGAGGAAVRSVLVQGRARIREGVWVVIFPEGTRMAPGQTRRYGISGALLAAQNDRFIVPVAHDAGYYWPRRGLYKQPGTIRVVIGPPIAAEGRDARELMAEAQRWIEANSRH